MKSIEDRIVDKIFSTVNFFLGKIIKPDIKVDKVSDIDKDYIDKLKNMGIKGVILDVDETLRKNMRDIPKCNSEWINLLKSELKVIVVSNGIDKNVQRFFEEKGIDYIGFAQKPFKKNIIKACDLLEVKPEEMMIIGDSLISDIYSGKKQNMLTALVKDVEEER